MFGERSSLGVMIYDSGSLDGTVYSGEWKENTWNGKGKLDIPNKELFRGFFKYGLKDGYGESIKTNGTYYKGMYLEGQMHGKGEFRFMDGTIYNGDFFYQKFQGTAKIRYSNGTVYEGEVLGGRRNGKGKFTKVTKDGQAKVFDGYWENNKWKGKNKRRNI